MRKVEEAQCAIQTLQKKNKCTIQKTNRNPKKLNYLPRARRSLIRRRKKARSQTRSESRERIDYKDDEFSLPRFLSGSKSTLCGLPEHQPLWYWAHLWGQLWCSGKADTARLSGMALIMTNKIAILIYFLLAKIKWVTVIIFFLSEVFFFKR